MLMCVCVCVSLSLSLLLAFTDHLINPSRCFLSACLSLPLAQRQLLDVSVAALEHKAFQLLSQLRVVFAVLLVTRYVLGGTFYLCYVVAVAVGTCSSR